MFGVFTTVKNNYHLTRKWLEMGTWLQGVPVLLLDVGSDTKEFDAQSRIALPDNVKLVVADSSSLQENYIQAFEYFKTMGIEWVVFSHQDNYCISNHFQDTINNYIEKGWLDSFGMVGFNTYHDADVEQYSPGKPIELMTLSRTPLEKTDGHYRRRVSSTFNYNSISKDVDAIAVFMPYFTALLMSRKMYLKYIEIDKNYQFFHALDDVAMQFLVKGVLNISLTKVSMLHDQTIKLDTPEDDLILKSPQAEESEVIKRYGRIDHLEVWRNKWGFRYCIEKRLFGLRVPHYRFFHYIDTISRKDYAKIRDIYLDTLVDDFYLNNPKIGALRSFKFKA